jgi:hypothetical protein
VPVFDLLMAVGAFLVWWHRLYQSMAACCHSTRSPLRCHHRRISDAMASRLPAGWISAAAVIAVLLGRIRHQVVSCAPPLP